jgi:acylphosphatase
MQQAHIFIKGHVQGVGYRSFVKKTAQKAGLTGWVQNLPDGDVDAVLQGEKAVIEETIDTLKRGHFLAQVKEIEVRWEEITTPYTEFIIQQFTL